MGTKVYFFSDTSYSRFDRAEDCIDDGYPLSVADNWPGFAQIGFDTNLDTALNWGNGKVFFFKGNKYARYDIAGDKVDDGYPLSIADNWPGMRDAGFADSIDADVFLGNGKVFFFKGDKYLRYDVAADKVDSGYPLAIADNWPGMKEAGFADSIDTAVNWGNGKVFFFKGNKY